MKRIYKYPVSPGPFRHMMPAQAEMLTVRLQNGHAMLWALVDTTAGDEWRSFVAIGTGFDITEHIIGYVGTFEIDEGHGPLVFHLFEVQP
jgi:hypothetical protein